MNLSNKPILNSKAKILVLLVLISWNICQSNPPAKVISLSLGRSFPFYFFKAEQEGVLKSVGPLKNSFYTLELGLLKHKLNLGFQVLKRDFQFNYDPVPGHIKYKKHMSSIFSLFVGKDFNLYVPESGKSKLFFMSNIYFSRLNDDIVKE